MSYTNDKEGRQKVMRKINELIEKGYERKDVNNKVEVSKMVLQGKKCSRVEKHEFSLGRNGIVHQIFTIDSGVGSAKLLLLGFSSPSTEAENACRAGLLDDADVTILRSHYTSRQWVCAGD